VKFFEEKFHAIYSHRKCIAKIIPRRFAFHSRIDHLALFSPFMQSETNTAQLMTSKKYHVGFLSASMFEAVQAV
jgi:hypothetical protein